MHSGTLPRRTGHPPWSNTCLRVTKEHFPRLIKLPTPRRLFRNLSKLYIQPPILANRGLSDQRSWFSAKPGDLVTSKERFVPPALPQQAEAVASDPAHYEAQHCMPLPFAEAVLRRCFFQRTYKERAFRSAVSRGNALGRSTRLKET
jgi:hypothetical protein